MAAGDLTDAEWELVGPFLVRKHGWPGQPRRDSRRMLDGILW
jgi:transposase